MGRSVKEQTLFHRSKKLKLNYTQKLLTFERMPEKFLQMAHGICELVVRGKGLRIDQGEKALWNPNVNVFWQEKAWVDSKVMRELAHSFVSHKTSAHGDKWVILFCDNLSAHLDTEVREIFGAGKVFLCFFPPNMTNFIQPIDAGLGRSVRTRIGH